MAKTAAARVGCEFPSEPQRRRPPVRRVQAAVFAVVAYEDDAELEDVEAAARPDMVAVELGLELVALMDVAL